MFALNAIKDFFGYNPEEEFSDVSSVSSSDDYVDDIEESELPPIESESDSES